MTETAEQRFRSALDRLKTGAPLVLPAGTPVSQNNVAKEAGVDPSALRKARYPSLIREIQAYVEIADKSRQIQRERQVQRRRARGDLKLLVKELQAQRDNAQSQLINAQRAVLELLQEKAMLQARIDELLPPPTPLHK